MAAFIRKLFRSPFPYFFALVLAGLYLLLPSFAGLLEDPLQREGLSLAHAIQKTLSLGYNVKGLSLALLFPWFLLWGLTLRFIHLLLKNRYRYLWAGALVVFLLLRIFPNTLLWLESDAPSMAYGTPAKGRIEHSKRIPFSGKNYTTYSFLGYLLGRTFVHEKVRETVLETYEKCEVEMPKIHFVLMETGKKEGGRFLPHRTHRNGMSVDFMTPMLKNGKPHQRHHLFNLWGYGWEFDDAGNKGDVTIDYETLAHHLLLLNETARKNGLEIQKVIFDPVLQPYLFQTPSGKKLKGLFYFTRHRVAFRHDDHYHVDFALLE